MMRRQASAPASFPSKMYLCPDVPGGDPRNQSRSPTVSYFDFGTPAAMWGYGQSNGPGTWGQRFPQAKGSRQSPVNISQGKVSVDKQVSPLQWNYVNDGTAELENTGTGWKCSLFDNTSELTGGPLRHRYRLVQFHMHWGLDDGEGSEHTIDGKPFAGELHFVHWNVDKYETYLQAADWEDGLAVIGVLLKPGAVNRELAKITNLLDQIPNRKMKCAVTNQVNIPALYPDRTEYWTYSGSLTTPPCSECVTWVVFNKSLEVSSEQLEQCRAMKSILPSSSPSEEDEFSGVVVRNYRPVQPLHVRVLRLCPGKEDDNVDEIIGEEEEEG